MIRFLLRRVLLTLPTFVALMFVTFIAIRLVPGDPVEVRVGEHGISPERLAVFRRVRDQLRDYLRCFPPEMSGG